MNDIDIASYSDAYYNSRIHPTKERSQFIEKFMPRFLEQMAIIYQTDINRFYQIYQQISNLGESFLLQNLRNLTNIPIHYNGGSRKRSMKRRKIKRRAISRK
jgi:hypothetical protein